MAVEQKTWDEVQRKTANECDLALHDLNSLFLKLNKQLQTLEAQKTSRDTFRLARKLLPYMNERIEYFDTCVIAHNFQARQRSHSRPVSVNVTTFDLQTAEPSRSRKLRSGRRGPGVVSSRTGGVS